MLRTTATMGIMAAVAVKAAPEPQKPASSAADCSLVCRPSELPIYGSLRKTE